MLIICYVHPPEVAPAGVMMRELADDLADAGHDVTLQTGWPNHPRGALFPGYHARWRSVERDGGHRLMRVAHAIRAKSSPLSRMWVYLTFAVSSLLNGLTLGRHDVVVCLSTPLLGVWTAWALARLWRGRFVNVIFDLWPEAIHNAGLMGENAVYRMALRLDTLNCRCSDAITALGEGVRQQIIARGVEAGKVTVVPFWMDTDKVRPLPRDNAWRREHGIAPERFVALFAGTIGYVSGAQILADAAEALAGRPDVLLLVVGEGVVKDELERLARQRGLRNMMFLPFQPADRLAEMQSAADVGLVTLRPDSGFSSVPSKVLGYMAAGRAVIASADQSTDTARLIVQAGCGLVTPPRDAQSLAQAITRLADDRPACQAFGERARQHVLAHYSRPVVVEQYRRIIEGRDEPSSAELEAHAFDAADTQTPVPPARRWWAVKYAVEWLIALVLLIVLLPLLGLLTILVKATSPGPALYISDRLGKGGRVFRLFKFRSMKLDAKMLLAADGKVITTDKDPRLTSIGRFLRMGFDELPQLFNVLKGDMCLIGPRPDVPWELDRYTPRHRSRLAVLPGVTGLTQVLDAREMNNAQNYELDVRYVACSNAWTDVLSALLTAPYSLGAKNIGRKAFRRYMQGLDKLTD